MYPYPIPNLATNKQSLSSQKKKQAIPQNVHTLFLGQLINIQDKPSFWSGVLLLPDCREKLARER